MHKAKANTRNRCNTPLRACFHFLWGDNEYKMRFGAKPHGLYSYFVYRSYSVDYILNNAKNLFIRLLFVSEILNILNQLEMP